MCVNLIDISDVITILQNYIEEIILIGRKKESAYFQFLKQMLKGIVFRGENRYLMVNESLWVILAVVEFNV